MVALYIAEQGSWDAQITARMPGGNDEPVADIQPHATSTTPASSTPAKVVDTGTPTQLPTLELANTTVKHTDGTNQKFRVPEGLCVKVAAEGVGKARFMAWSPDQRLFVPDMVDYLLSPGAKLYALENFDPETGRFATSTVFLSDLLGVNDVAFYRDADGQDWIYVAETAYLRRWPYQAGDQKPSGPAEVIAYFPGKQSPGETSVVWHITRTLEFVGDQLYVSVGSGCNSCEELAGERAHIEVMDADGSNRRVYATGLRNAVGLEWANDTLYATANGADHLGINTPDEALFAITEGTHYAWPYCYLEAGEWLPDSTSVWQREFDCSTAPAPITTFPPRSAPLGFTYFDATWHPAVAQSFLVALHGSFEAALGRGYQIVRVTEAGERDVFMDGFQLPGKTRVARPVDILPYDEQSFFFSDDHGGRIYFVQAPTDVRD